MHKEDTMSLEKTAKEKISTQQHLMEQNMLGKLVRFVCSDGHKSLLYHETGDLQEEPEAQVRAAIANQAVWHLLGDRLSIDFSGEPDKHKAKEDGEYLVTEEAFRVHFMAERFLGKRIPTLTFTFTRMMPKDAGPVQAHRLPAYLEARQMLVKCEVKKDSTQRRFRNIPKKLNVVKN